MLNDIRYAIRALRQNRGFAFTAIISIGLAIGANSSIFGFIDAILLRPLPIPRASKVVSLRQIEPTASASGLANLGGRMSYPDLLLFMYHSLLIDHFFACGLDSYCTGF